MQKRIASTMGATVLAIGLAGGVAYAAVQSVSTTPDSQVVIPPRSGHSPSHGADDPTTHDTNDDNGATTGGVDDPVGDDNGGLTSDDPVGDDSGSGHGGGGDD